MRRGSIISLCGREPLGHGVWGESPGGTALGVRVLAWGPVSVCPGEDRGIGVGSGPCSEPPSGVGGDPRLETDKVVR